MARSKTKEKTHYTHEELLCIWSELAEIVAAGSNGISIPKLIIEKWGVCRPTADKWYDCAKQLLYQTWDKSTLAEMKSKRLQTLEMTIERGMRTNQLGSVIGAVRLQAEMLGLVGK